MTQPAGAGVATVLVHATGNPVFDAVGSIAIGALLGATACFLIQQNRSFLIGAQRGPLLAQHAVGRPRSVRGMTVRHPTIQDNLQAGVAQVMHLRSSIPTANLHLNPQVRTQPLRVLALAEPYSRWT